MAYQSLYRKYRPQTFGDVVGQGHVTRTLQNAIASGRIAHGYLFTGTRGTAKTTVARLLAKALNCESQPHPVTEPCNKCAACTSITQGSSVDVIEMDAASHRGVADIEEVRKSVGYGPMELRYKVFIIDEAHQLSSDAKDAFLKTLEEPPDNVVFILATTEPQAIPITIRSRCQQFDFKRGSLSDITTRLRYVLDCEGVTYAPEAINLVARGAEGSYRDSLSLLEQVLAFAPSHISAADVETVLGALDTEMLGRVIEAVSRRDAPTLFALAGELLDSGKEARTLLRTLALHFRDLMLVSVGGPAVAQELTPEEVGRLQQQARLFTPPQMMKAIEALNEAQGETRWNNQHRLLVELTFLKLATLGDAPAATSASSVPAAPFVTAPIVFGTAPNVAPAGPPPARTPPVPTRPVAAAPVAFNPTPPEPKVTAPPVPAAPSTPEPEAIAPETVETEDAPESLSSDYFGSDESADAEDDYVPDDEPAPVAATAAGPTPSAESEGFPVYSGEDEPLPPLEEPVDTLTGDLFGDDESAPAPPLATPLPPEPEPEGPGLFDEPELETIPVSAAAPTPHPFVEPTPVAPETLYSAPEPDLPPAFQYDDVLRCWPHLLQKAFGISRRTQMMLLRAEITDVVRDVVEITFKERANFDMMNQPRQQEFVQKLLKHCLGNPPHVIVHFRLDDAAAPPPPRRPAAKKKVERDPIKLLDLDDGPAEPDVFSGGNAPPYSAPPRSNGYSGNGSGSSVQESYSAPRPSYTPSASPPRRSNGSSGSDSIPTYEDSQDTSLPAPRGNGKGNGANNGTTEISAFRAAALENPLVQEALSIFGGDIVEDGSS